MVGIWIGGDEWITIEGEATGVWFPLIGEVAKNKGWLKKSNLLFTKNLGDWLCIGLSIGNFFFKSGERVSQNNFWSLAEKFEELLGVIGTKSLGSKTIWPKSDLDLDLNKECSNFKSKVMSSTDSTPSVGKDVDLWS